MINGLKLFRIIFKNNRLNGRRSPMFEQTKVGMIFTAIGTGVSAIYLIAIGTMLGYTACQDGGQFNSIFGLLPILMIFDFVLRLSIQQAPSMLVKPYVVLPIRQKDIITCFLVSSLYSAISLIWFFLWIPYLIICICGGMSWGIAIGQLFILYIITAINGLWYLLVRTLANQNILYWSLPIVLCGLMGIPFILYSDKGFDYIFKFCIDYGFSWIAIGLYLFIFYLLFVTNQRVQLHFAKKEVARKETVRLKEIPSFSFLDTWGVTGEYLKLEIKAALRCKSIRSRYLQGLFLIIMFSCLLAYTDIYSDDFSHNGICLYCFLFFGAVNLVKIMQPEGNYIDLLMVNKENILTLLRAKYYFYCSVLILPTLLLLPTIITGKISYLMILSYLLFTAGPLYCILFQLAVYNKQTIPLNEKVTGKNKAGNTLQTVVSLFSFIFPVIFNMILKFIFNENSSYYIMIGIGLFFVSSRELWLRNIYNRMMKRHYDNLNSFHATR